MDTSILNSIAALHDELIAGLQRAVTAPDAAANIQARIARPAVDREMTNLLQRGDQLNNTVLGILTEAKKKPDARVTKLLRAAATPAVVVRAAAPPADARAAAQPSAVKPKTTKPKKKTT